MMCGLSLGLPGSLQLQTTLTTDRRRLSQNSAGRPPPRQPANNRPSPLMRILTSWSPELPSLLTGHQGTGDLVTQRDTERQRDTGEE